MLDKKGNPVPFANIRLTNLIIGFGTMWSTDGDGKL